MTTLLVIGKNGQLGQSLIELGGEHFDSVIDVDKEECDITSNDDCERVMNDHQPTVIINAAAYNAVPACEDNPIPAFQVNAFAVHRLARLARKKNVRFITYSSDYVFDGKKTTPYEENDITRPLQQYGISKLAGEYAAQNVNPDAVIIRTSSLYGGLSGSPIKGNFVLYILQQAKEQRELEVGSEQRMSPTYAPDLALATFGLLNKNATGGIYHLTNEGDCSWSDFAQAIVTERGLSLTITPVDRSGESVDMARPQYSVLENVRAKHLGVTLPEWKDALGRYLNTLP